MHSSFTLLVLCVFCVLGQVSAGADELGANEQMSRTNHSSNVDSSSDKSDSISSSSCVSGGLATAPVPTSGKSEQLTSLEFLLVTVTLGVIILVAYKVHALHSQFLSESGAIIIFGIVMGGFFYLMDYLMKDRNFLLSSVKFDRSLFINVLLPVIIFEAGFSLKHSGVMRNLGAVLVYAVLGTMISTILIGLGVFYMSQFVAPDLYSHDAGLFISLALGALLSATDPVSVIALLGSQFDMSKEPPLLYNIVFGESVLNDAVAIVIYNVCSTYIEEPNVTASSLGVAFGSFLEIFCLSTIIGYVVGLLCALLFKHIRLDELPHLEVAMCMIFGAASYYLCDFLEMSGIMGLFMTARIIGHHATHNMSVLAKVSTSFVLKTLAVIAEMAVFVLLGTSLWAHLEGWNGALCVVVVLCCLLSRVAVVFPLSVLCNLTRTTERIHIRMQCFMWYSGLRGAIAFGLVILLNSEPNVGAKVGGQVLTSTLAVILFTVLFMGGFAASLLNFLNLGQASIDEENLRLDHQRLENKMKKIAVRASMGIVPSPMSRQPSMVHGGTGSPHMSQQQQQQSFLSTPPTLGNNNNQRRLEPPSSGSFPMLTPPTGSVMSSHCPQDEIGLNRQTRASRMSRVGRMMHPKEAMAEIEELDEMGTGFGAWIILLEKTWIEDFVRRKPEEMLEEIDYNARACFTHHSTPHSMGEQGASLLHPNESMGGAGSQANYGSVPQLGDTKQHLLPQDAATGVFTSKQLSHQLSSADSAFSGGVTNSYMGLPAQDSQDLTSRGGSGRRSTGVEIENSQRRWSEAGGRGFQRSQTYDFNPLI